MNLLFTSFDRVTVLRHYPYRTGRLKRLLLSLEYKRGEEADILHKKCAKQAGYSPDNHECFVVNFGEGGIVALKFSDWKMQIGFAVEEIPPQYR